MVDSTECAGSRSSTARGSSVPTPATTPSRSHPPPPRAAIADVGAAVRDALRFPLAGDRWRRSSTRGAARHRSWSSRPHCPSPARTLDPRQARARRRRRRARGARRPGRAADDPRRRRPRPAPAGRRRSSASSTPEAREFRGDVVVHDADDPDLVDARLGGEPAARLPRTRRHRPGRRRVSGADHRCTAAPHRCSRRRDAATVRGTPRPSRSCAQPPRRPGRWHSPSRRARCPRPAIGASLSLDLPRLSGRFAASRTSRPRVDRLAALRSTPRSRCCRAPCAWRVLRDVGSRARATAAFGGPPSVAHAEALLRGIEPRQRRLDEPLDTLCIGIPRTTLALPRERPNALAAAAMGLGYALRLWRDAFPVREGGTVILVAPLPALVRPPRRSSRTARSSRRRDGGPPSATLAEAERAAAADTRAIDAYRVGRTCHPRLPFADWAACRPALDRLGRVLVAGCRDASRRAPARVRPRATRSRRALEMAHGLGGGRAPRRLPALAAVRPRCSSGRLS